MRAPTNSADGSLDPNVDDVRAVALSAWPIRRLRDVTVLISAGLAACTNSADPGSIEQIVRALLN